MIPLRGRKQENSDGSSSRAGIKSKVKRAKIVVLLGCAFLVFNNSLNKITQRQMKCEVNKLQGRNLSIETEGASNNVSFKDFILRLLETVDDPCYTDYPPAAPDEVTYTSDSVEANKEPEFTITDLEPVPPIGVDGNYDVLDEATSSTMDETQKDLLDSFPPESYDEDRALLTVTTDDAGTVAYCVALTGCAEWYDPANNALLTTDQGTSSTTTSTTDTTTTTTTDNNSVPAEQTTDTATTSTTDEGTVPNTDTTTTTDNNSVPAEQTTGTNTTPTTDNITGISVVYDVPNISIMDEENLTQTILSLEQISKDAIIADFLSEGVTISPNQIIITSSVVNNSARNLASIFKPRALQDSPGIVQDINFDPPVSAINTDSINTKIATEIDNAVVSGNTNLVGVSSQTSVVSVPSEQTTDTATTTTATTTPDAGADVYEDAATLKANICENNEVANSRALKKTEKRWDTERKLATDLGYQMHALIHPMANTCPIEGTSGEMYDRTQLFQSQEYNVELLGHPIVDTMLYDTQPYIVENIESDVGIRDSMKLNIWKMITHPVAVLMAFDTIQLNPITDEIDMLLANPALKGYYISTPPDASTGGQGVDTSFLIVKPSVEEFNTIISGYVNTPFDPVSGWNGQGYHNFKGGMGISGYLAYYFANNPAYQELDRCRYGFNADDACVADIADDFSVVNNAISYENVCGDPKKCPYDDPSLPPAQLEYCHELHKKFYTHRYQFEEKYFNKKHKQKRIGLFKRDTFLGYCREPGTTGQLPITGDVFAQPSWQTICPPEPCPEGTLMKSDCSCTAPESPCDACPEGTYCQTSPALMCIDSKCGFCDSSAIECCEFNGINNSRSGPGNNQECSMQNNFFPAFGGSGNICGGVEIKRTAVPNGCGCKPQKGSPCTYNHDWASGDKKCFICNAADLAAGKCDTCKDCMSNCSAGACMNTSLTVDDFVNCMEGINDTECRSNCHFNCMKQ